MSLRPDFNAALDPARSAVVEACAGSGKTWLLASRILRLLLAGCAPSEILAITFTRKAAREIEERVVDWLRELATAAEDAAAHFLLERGAPADAATLAKARGLYERVTCAQPGLAVNTFHGWFLQLVAVAPLSANLAGTTLADDGSRRFEELWQTFARRLQREPESDAARAFVRLLQTVGLTNTRILLRRGMSRRAEWLACVGNAAQPVSTVLADLQGMFNVTEPGAEVARFLTETGEGDIQACADILLGGTKTEADVGQALLAALTIPSAEERFAALQSELLTKEGGLRQKLAESSAAMIKRFGEEPAAQLVARYCTIAERMQRAVAQLQEERNLAFNGDALTLHHAFLQHLDEFKAERRQIDFVDAEWRVLKLLQDEASAAFIQARLDARYRHVLLDEFQDTNPLQWQILLAWLSAYTDAARPTVFLVGDPKQSIYRFRRAEPRLFATAAEFLEEHFAAARLAQDETRRNAPAIIDVINALFAPEPGFAPFRTQVSLAHGLPGRVELLPLFADKAAAVPEAADAIDPLAEVPAIALRNPLREPAAENVDLRRQHEAAALAQHLSALVGRTLVRERQGQHDIERPLRYGDVLLLVRKRAQIAIYEQALAAASIPFSAASRGGLLESLEVRDIVALLEFLVTPAADLQLAHVLKSPVFACSDEDLLQLADRAENGWWNRLIAAAAAGGSTRLNRAAVLLSGWIKAAALLPAHDLLDRIYHEGGVAVRYRLAVPEARRAAALANLEALLLLALDLDGGRYPSLPRFIDELKALKKAEGDDAPDEGELAEDEATAADGRVRIMTIHGAKGLEAPLVWLLDAHATPATDKPWEVLVDWAPEEPAPRHFSFVGKKDERGHSREALFEAEAAAAAREELNLLYVAVTRAKQLFIASGISNERLGAAQTAYGRLQAALAGLGSEQAHGEPLPTADHDAKPVPGAGSLTVPAQPLLPALPIIGERRAPPDAAARFGILLHALLERRTENREEVGWWRDMGYTDAELGRVRPVAERLLAAPSLQRFFDPACYRRAWNEMEITDETGAVCRMDRLVEDAEAFWVLDYKSSAAGNTDRERLAEYQTQVAGYCRAVAA
ncbi:MAG: ATP-dependent helicase/nuclease subunit, partial [Pseudomonadota bacterium]|nr:ATP-dependent helicase/nuclease subunit [Pseudomonadota bacterium]